MTRPMLAALWTGGSVGAYIGLLSVGWSLAGCPLVAVRLLELVGIWWAVSAGRDFARAEGAP